MSDDRQARLLTEIRDTLREQLAEYRRVTSESLAIQRAAAETQRAAVETQLRSARYAEGLGRLYRIVVGVLAVAALVVIGALLASELR